MILMKYLYLLGVEPVSISILQVYMLVSECEDDEL